MRIQFAELPNPEFATANHGRIGEWSSYGVPIAIGFPHAEGRPPPEVVRRGMHNVHNPIGTDLGCSKNLFPELSLILSKFGSADLFWVDLVASRHLSRPMPIKRAQM